MRRIAAGDRVGLSVGLAVSLLFALWSASAGVYNLDRAIRTAYGLRPQSYVQARGRALLGALVIVLALGLTGLVSAAVGVVLGHVPGFVVAIVGIPSLFALVAVAIAGLYRFSVGTRVGWRTLLPGSVAGAVGLLVLGTGFSVYLHYSTHYTAVYGALAGAVIAMIGTYFAVYIVLLGAVLNMQLAGRSPSGAG